MKNIKLFVAAALIFAVTQLVSVAIQPIAINEPALVNENTAEQVKSTGGPGGALYYDKFAKLSERYTNNLRECVPAHYGQYIDLFGFKLSINMDINGWINDKCEYKFTANVGSIGKDIREVFEIKVSDEKIAQLKPVAKCNFTKAQLNTLVDAIIARNKQESLSKLVESSDKKLKTEKPQLTPEEEKLAMMLLTENACAITNKEEMMKLWDEIVKSSTSSN